MATQRRMFPDLARRTQMTHLLHRVAHLRRQAFDSKLKPYDITAIQWWVLGRLARSSDAGLTQTELARALESGKVSVGAMIARLEGLGLVERRDDPLDKRIRRILLTNGGRNAVERITAVSQDIDQAILDGVDSDELDRFIATLSLVKANLHGMLD